MKYLEQRVEDLEKEVQELKIKLFQKEFKETKHDYMYNYPNMTLLSETKSEADFPPYPNILGSWDPNPDYVDSADLPTYYPPANPEDVIEDNNAGFNNLRSPIIVRKHASEFDKMDKDFSNHMKSKSFSNTTKGCVNTTNEKFHRTKN